MESLHPAQEISKMHGIVKWFNDAKGYGFLVADDGADVFVHHSVIQMDGYRTLKEGQQVFYESFETDRGRQAARVTAAAQESALAA